MRSKFFKNQSIVKYFWSFILILFTTITIIYIYITWQYNINNSVSTLKTQSSRIEKAFSDTVDYTAYLIDYLTAQIRDNNPQDLKYINNLLSSFRLNQDVNNKIPWNMFSWINKKAKLVVNSDKGIVPPVDVADRDYFQESITDVEKMHLGKLTIGRVSKKAIIPAGMAIEDSAGRFIGAMVFGIQTDKLSYKLSSALNARQVDFAIFDKDFSRIVSSRNFIEDKYISENIRNVDFNKNKSGILTNFSLFFNNSTLSYYQKIDKYPYIIVVAVDRKLLEQELLSKIIPYLFELLLILLILFIITFVFKKLIINPVSKLAVASQKISSDNGYDIIIPRSQIPEINQLSKSILSIKKYVKREQFLKHELEVINEELDKSNNYLQRLLKAVSHDLRNYISGISGLANIIGDDQSEKPKSKQDQQTLQYTQIIIQQSGEMLSFVEDLLNVDKNAFEAINSKNLEDCNIKDLIEEIILLKQKFLAENKIKIKTNIEKNPPALRYDKRRLRQILDNLITNAVKYSCEGEEVLISCRAVNNKNPGQKNKQIYIEIADNGIGMNEEEVKMALLGEGKNIDKSTLGKPINSHGIGLPLVKTLVDLHNSKMDIISKKGKGTTIKLWFDINNELDVEASSHSKQISKTLLKKSDSRKNHNNRGVVLVAEDEIATRMVVSHILQNNGYKVLSAENGKQVLKILDEERCDLILLDTQMPELGGYEATKIIRDGTIFQNFKNYKTIPMIAFSGNVDKESKKIAKDSGMNDYLGKPFLKEELLKIVDKYIISS
jgi:two-component system sensor histidine kinase ChiS